MCAERSHVDPLPSQLVTPSQSTAVRLNASNNVSLVALANPAPPVAARSDRPPKSSEADTHLPSIWNSGQA